MYDAVFDASTRTAAPTAHSASAYPPLVAAWADADATLLSCSHDASPSLFSSCPRRPLSSHLASAVAPVSVGGSLGLLSNDVVAFSSPNPVGLNLAHVSSGAHSPSVASRAPTRRAHAVRAIHRRTLGLPNALQPRATAPHSRHHAASQPLVCCSAGCNAFVPQSLIVATFYCSAPVDPETHAAAGSLSRQPPPDGDCPYVFPPVLHALCAPCAHWYAPRTGQCTSCPRCMAHCCPCCDVPHTPPCDHYAGPDEPGLWDGVTSHQFPRCVSRHPYAFAATPPPPDVVLPKPPLGPPPTASATAPSTPILWPSRTSRLAGAHPVRTAPLHTLIRARPPLPVHLSPSAPSTAEAASREVGDAEGDASGGRVGDQHDSCHLCMRDADGDCVSLCLGCRSSARVGAMVPAAPLASAVASPPERIGCVCDLCDCRAVTNTGDDGRCALCSLFCLAGDASPPPPSPPPSRPRRVSFAPGSAPPAKRRRDALPATSSIISQEPRDPTGFHANRARVRGLAHHHRVQGLISDLPYLRGVLGDGLFQRLNAASLFSDEPVLADLVSRDVSVEGIDAHLRDLTGDGLRGVDRSRLLALGASREAELRRQDAADVVETDSEDEADAATSDPSDEGSTGAA